MPEATRNARREIEYCWSDVRQAREGLVRDLEALDVRLTDVSRAFDQMVLSLLALLVQKY